MTVLRTIILMIFIIYVQDASEVFIPDLTLLSKVTQDNNTNFTCVAGANVRGSAITFIFSLRPAYSYQQVSMYKSAQGPTYPLDGFECDFEPGSPCVTNWTRNGSVVMSSMSESSRIHDLKLVTDERWEKFTTYFSIPETIQEYTFEHDVRSIGISVRTSIEANVLLCEDKDTTSCYRISLPRRNWVNITLWDCKNINSNRSVRDINCSLLAVGQATSCSEMTWTHYQLIMKYEDGGSLFTIKGLENNDDLIRHAANVSLNIRKLLLYIESRYDPSTNKRKGLWKIHEYNYLSLPSNFANHHLLYQIGPTFQVDKSGSVCMELYVSVCPACTLKLGVSNTLEFTEIRGQDIMQSWRLVRIQAQNLPQNKVHNLQVMADGDPDGFWLIDDVRSCDKDETRLISLEESLYDKDIVSCQALQQPNWWSSIITGKIEQSNLTVCNNQTYIGTNCNISCMTTLGTDCSNVMVCEPSMSRMNLTCTCAVGYHGDQCQEECPQGYYGTGCTRKCEPCRGRCLPTSDACIMDDQQTQSDSNPAFYALLLLLLLIPGILYVWFFCRDRRTSNSETQINMPLLTFISRNQDTKSYPIKVKQLAKYIKKINNNELKLHYKSLPRGLTKPCSYGMLKNNVYKNRFKDVTAYDHSRVVLKVIGGDPYSDFINANYIDGYKQPKTYIATQGPKANTLNDFWRMIWQENVELIVMLTSIANDKQTKHEQYWPDNENKTQEFIDISVKICKEDVYADFVHRLLEVKCEEDVRQIQHLQFTSWPDNDVPAHPQLLVPFFHEIRSLSTNTPIVVHCSDGVGRTGTVILIDICVRMATQTGQVDPLKYLHRMREQRVDMVTCFDQYKLVHAVLLEYLLAPDSSIHCDNKLPNVISNIIKKKLSQEIAYLHESEWYHQILRNDATPSNEISEIVSYDCDSENVKSDNMVSVDGFKVKDQYIVIPSTQGNDIYKFWAIIIEYNLEMAFILDDLSDCEMWPTEAEQMFEFSDLTIKCIYKSEGLNYNKYKFQLHIKSSLEVRLVQVLVQSPEQMGAQALAQLAAEALKAVQRWRSVAVGGASGAELVVLAHVMERMIERHQCDVLGSLRALRACDLACLPDKHQLQLLYSASVHVLDELDGYMLPNK